jgi:tetratricopeptide (TPR) repeat protein/DNA-binding response OmpR family regulator
VSPEAKSPSTGTEMAAQSEAKPNPGHGIEPAVLLVGADEKFKPAFQASLARHRVFVETAEIDQVVDAVVAAAPDLVLLMGVAAKDCGSDILSKLSALPESSVVPVVILDDETELDAKLRAFRHGATAIIPRSASIDAIAEQVAKLAREIPERGSETLGELGEATLEEFVSALSKQLRSGILSVSGAGGEAEAVRLVLGRGRPLAEFMDNFVRRVRRHVVRAEPLRYEFDERAGGTVELLDAGGAIKAGAKGNVEGVRVILADDDTARADAVAQALRARGATVVVTDLDPSDIRFGKLRQVDPAILMIGEAHVQGGGYSLVKRMRQDTRLRWASLLVVRWDEVWSERTGVPSVEAFEATLAGLADPERSLRERAQQKAAFDTRLEAAGPARCLRALAATGSTLRVSVQHPRVKVEIDVSDGLIVGATGRTLDERAEVIEGVHALSAFLVLASGRLRIESVAQPASANVMATVDVALNMADAEPPPIPPSLPAQPPLTEREETKTAPSPRAPAALVTPSPRRPVATAEPAAAPRPAIAPRTISSAGIPRVQMPAQRAEMPAQRAEMPAQRADAPVAPRAVIPLVKPGDEGAKKPVSTAAKPVKPASSVSTAGLPKARPAMPTLTGMAPPVLPTAAAAVPPAAAGLAKSPTADAPEPERPSQPNVAMAHAKTEPPPPPVFPTDVGAAVAPAPVAAAKPVGLEFDRTISASISSVLGAGTLPQAVTASAPPLPDTTTPAGFTSFGPSFIPTVDVRRPVEIAPRALAPNAEPAGPLKRWFGALESKVHAERITLPTALGLVALACLNGLIVVGLIAVFRDKPDVRATAPLASATATPAAVAVPPTPPPSAAPAAATAPAPEATVPPDGSEKAAPTCEQLWADSPPNDGDYPGASAEQSRNGRAAIVKGDLVLAHASFCRAAHWDAKNPDTALQLAQVLLLRRDGKQALPWAERAVALDPQAATAKDALGDALARLGAHERARRTWFEAAGLDPNDAEAARGILNRELKQADRAFRKRDFVASERYFRRAAVLDPTSVAALTGLSSVLVLLEDAAPAVVWGKRAVAAAPRNPYARLILGDALAAASDQTAAIAEWREASLLDPSLNEARARLRRAGQ